MRTLLSSIAITAALAAVAPTMASADGKLAQAQHETRVAQTRPASSARTVNRLPDTAADRARYERAEQESPKAADFTGGGVLVIAGSGTALVVALIVLVLIL